MVVAQFVAGVCGVNRISRRHSGHQQLNAIVSS